MKKEKKDGRKKENANDSWKKSNDRKKAWRKWWKAAERGKKENWKGSEKVKWIRKRVTEGGTTK